MENKKCLKPPTRYIQLYTCLYREYARLLYHIDNVGKPYACNFRHSIAPCLSETDMMHVWTVHMPFTCRSSAPFHHLSISIQYQYIRSLARNSTATPSVPRSEAQTNSDLLPGQRESTGRENPQVCVAIQTEFAYNSSTMFHQQFYHGLPPVVRSLHTNPWVEQLRIAEGASQDLKTSASSKKASGAQRLDFHPQQGGQCCCCHLNQFRNSLAGQVIPYHM